MNQQKIILAVESICNTGCKSVNAVIQTLESGQPIKEFENFSHEELNIVKIELKSIMAIYKT